jgi:hypothetical protein
MSMINHTFLVIAHRIHYMQTLRGWKWTSERVRSAEGGGRGHRPDGVLRRGKKSIAVEIELTPKALAVIVANIISLAENHTKAYIHCSEDLRKRIQEIVAAMNVDNVFVLGLVADHLWFPQKAEEGNA